MPSMHDPNEDKPPKEPEENVNDGGGDGDNQVEEEDDVGDFGLGDDYELIEDDDECEGEELNYNMDDMDLAEDAVIDGCLGDDEDEDDEEEDIESEEEIPDESKVTFDKHKESVFSVDTFGNLAVTGAQDDTAYVWNMADGSCLFECKGHRDSVTCVGFSHDGKYVATVDMAGDIKVWNVPSGEEAWTEKLGDTEWIEWHRSAPVLVVGTADGDVWIFNIHNGQSKILNSHGFSCTVGKIMPDGKKLCAGYADGSMKVWDMKTCKAIYTVNDQMKHSGAVTTIDCRHDNTMVATGGTDGTVRLHNTSVNGKVVSVLVCSGGDTSVKEGMEREDGVEVVSFHPNSNSSCNYFSVATLKGNLMVYEFGQQEPRHTMQHPAGVSKLAWHSTELTVYCACLDGVLRRWDVRSGTLSSELRGHCDAILDMTLSSDGEYIVTTSDDHTAKVFQF